MKRVVSITVACKCLMLVAMLCLDTPVLSQNQFFNLNIKNGLPSNHVYRTLVDHNGYLWIATDKGVVKYNGYTTKIFDATSGIANDDVWNIYEDKKGRMWFASISDEIGYVFKDRYHKAILQTPVKMYPTDFIDDDRGGIIFLTADKRYSLDICTESNDTIRSYSIRKKIKVMLAKDFLSKDLGAITYNHGWLYQVLFNYNSIKYYQFRKVNTRSDSHLPVLQGNFLFFERKDKSDDTVFYITNIKTGFSQKIPMLSSEELIQGIEYNKQLYLTTTKNAYRVDERLNIPDHINFQWLRSNDINLVTFMQDLRWNKCISTSDRGMVIASAKNNFVKADSILKRGQFVGSYHDSIYYWWNVEEKELNIKYREKQLTTIKCPNVGFILKIAQQTPDSAIVIANDALYIFSKGVVSKYFKNYFTPYQIVNDTVYYALESTSKLSWSIPYKLQDCIVDSNKIIHAVMAGFSYSNLSTRNDSFLIKTIDKERYEQVVFYEPLNCYIVRGKSHILIEKGNSIIKLSAKQLELLGLKNIQQILYDSSGNIFIKAREKLLCYSPQQRKTVSLINNYNLNGCNIHLYKNNLVAAGRFGIIRMKIQGNLHFERPSLIPNFKGQNYSVISQSYILENYVVLNTDMGIFSVDLNINERENNYLDFSSQASLNVSTFNFEQPVHTLDTITLDHDHLQLIFDVINPNGNGTVKFTYSIDDKSYSDWLSGNDIDLSTLTPGTYHTVKLNMADDSWRSDNYILYFYVTPYWWQTNSGKILLLLFIVLGIFTISTITIIATRNILNKKHARENKYLELELKSIYAQLNPHFIFNTLSNIVYYIKKDRKQEAYKYLNTFSKLLRSYIKSSRNKWLPLSEELENIDSYILLQQTRFDDKFDYSIIVDPELDADKLMLPSLLLQPLVENSIHHGLQPKEEKGTLTLSFKKGKEDNIIVILIEDDGIGRLQSKKIATNSLNKKESFGSDLLKDLIAIYKHYELFSIDLDYYDKISPETGTIVTLTIKYNP
ncbi:MAG: hypothetical protein EOP47_08000 [Sphingobacteriaceae bacterium]|nr:MAG: hypothetical protein EOP47_08000 [Sphingobacteriaceae bacterium]